MSARDYERARSALAFIPPDDRDMWVSMGMALKDGFGEEGFDLWDAWSRQSDRYNERDTRDVWRSLKAGRGITLGTLFHEAKAHGWRDDGTHRQPTPEELEARRRQAAERAAKEETRKSREHTEAAKKARALWADATSVREAHPYLARKGVPSVPSLREIDAGVAAAILGYAPKSRDEPLTGRLLIVPVKIGGELSTVELIDEAGCKSALFGGAKAGGYWDAQPLPEGDGAGLTLLIGEGPATILSAIEATGYLAIAALSCGNLPAVAREMRERFPAAALVILADLVRATGEPDPHAIEAARAIGGLVAVPDFGENGPGDATDFNDLHRARGAESVRGCVERATSPGGGEDPQDTVARLASLASIEYDRVRQTESDALGVRVTTLDGEVEKARRKLVGDGNNSSQGDAVLFPDIEPWPEPVDGALLLTDLAARYRHHVVLTEHAPAVLALWTLFTHCIDVVSVAPILALTSPEKRCGKSTVLALLRRLARRPLPSANISAAALFRSVEAWSPTLLIDEPTPSFGAQTSCAASSILGIRGTWPLSSAMSPWATITSRGASKRGARRRSR